MKLIDVTVPLDAGLPTYPGNTPFALDRSSGSPRRQLERLEPSA